MTSHHPNRPAMPTSRTLALAVGVAMVIFGIALALNLPREEPDLVTGAMIIVLGVIVLFVGFLYPAFASRRARRRIRPTRTFDLEGVPDEEKDLN